MRDARTEMLSRSQGGLCFYLMNSKTFMPRRHPSDDAWSYCTRTPSALFSLNQGQEDTHDLTVAADGVPKTYAPPAYFFAQVLALHCQIPTADRRTETLPQAGQGYLECWVISIFLTLWAKSDEYELRKGGGKRVTYVFLNEAPYRTPYFPVIPTFLVRLV